MVRGVPIADADRDGLDDNWETNRFGALDRGPLDDPDLDGYNNAREQIMGTDPSTVDVAFELDLSPFDEGLARLSWPGVTNRNYEVFADADTTSPPTLVTNLPGRFPETEWFTPRTNLAHQFFRVRALAR